VDALAFVCFALVVVVAVASLVRPIKIGLGLDAETGKLISSRCCGGRIDSRRMVLNVINGIDFCTQFSVEGESNGGQ
jgi:hypothetical protein